MVDVSDFHPGSRGGYDASYKQSHVYHAPPISGYGAGSFMKKHWGKVLLASAAATAAAAAGTHMYLQHKKRKGIEDEVRAQRAAEEEADDRALHVLERAEASDEPLPNDLPTLVQLAVEGNYKAWNKVKNNARGRVNVLRRLQTMVRLGNNTKNYRRFLYDYSPEIYHVSYDPIRRVPKEVPPK